MDTFSYRVILTSVQYKSSQKAAELHNLSVCAKPPWGIPHHHRRIHTGIDSGYCSKRGSAEADDRVAEQLRQGPCPVGNLQLHVQISAGTDTEF